MVMTNRFLAEAAAGVNLGTIKILGFPSNPDAISVNGVGFTNYVYDATNRILDMTLNIPLQNDFNILFNYQNP